MPAPGSQLADLLADSQNGQERATNDLQAMLYLELRQMAVGCLRGERVGHTLQPTALVHEAYLRLAQASLTVGARTHLLALAATTMRRVLVDHARRRGAGKRAAGACVDIDATLILDERAQAGVDILAVHEALERLGGLDARQARIVEMRFFAGLTADEIAASLGLSRRTVQGDWNMARAWLRAEMRDDRGDDTRRDAR